MVETETIEIVSEFEHETETLMQLLDQLSEEELNRKPFEGSWTAAQVGSHLYKSYKGVPALLVAPAEDSNRVPDALVPGFREAFLNFNIKFQSPDFIVPEERHYNKLELLEKISKVRLEIILKIKTLDLTKLCTSFQLPGTGNMTRLEWVHFMVVHTKRHNHQLRKIIVKIHER